MISVKRFKKRAKKHDKLMILIIVLVAIVGLSVNGLFTQRSFDTFAGVIGPEDTSAMPGDFIDLHWKTKDNSSFVETFESYEVKFSLNGGEVQSLFNSPIRLINTTFDNEIVYTYDSSNNNIGDIVIVMLNLYVGNETFTDSVRISFESETMTTTSTIYMNTTTVYTPIVEPTTDIGLLGDIDERMVLFVVILSGVGIFITVIFANVWGKQGGIIR